MQSVAFPPAAEKAQAAAVTAGSDPWPAGRYGRRRTPRRAPRWLVPLLVVGVVLAGLAVSWRMYDTYQGDKIQSQVTKFRQVSASQIAIEFQVVTSAGEAATCILRARSEDGQEVGRAEVPVPASESGNRSVVVTYTLATSERAVTGEVYGCAPGRP